MMTHYQYRCTQWLSLCMCVCVPNDIVFQTEVDSGWLCKGGSGSYVWFRFFFCGSGVYVCVRCVYVHEFKTVQ